MATGMAPQTTAQGVNTELMNSVATATALAKGQILGLGKVLRWSGSASTTVVTSASRDSSARPVTARGSEAGTGA